MFLTVPRLFYQIFQLLYGNRTKLFCGIFSENHKYSREIFLRRLRDATEKTSFSRFVRDVFKTSCKRRLFWDVFETSQRRHKKDIFFEMHLRRLKDVTKKSSLLRYFWEVSKMSLSMEIWLRSLRDISCRLGTVIWTKNFVFRTCLGNRMQY